MLGIWSGIYLITSCVFAAKFNKQNNAVESDSTKSMDNVKPLNVSEYHVSLRLRSLESVKFGNGHFCSGVMLTSYFVLTVAHCVQGVHKNEIIVVKGSTDLTKKHNETLIYQVRKMFVHESYKKEFKTYDIAILELRSNNSTKSNTKIPLGNPDSVLDLDEGTECQTGGWGATKNHDISETLKTANVKFMSPETCNVTAPFTGKVQESMLCASTSKKAGPSTCVGDSGAALLCQNKVVGLVSWGQETCGKQNLPTVYTDVGYYSNWIKSKMNRKCEIDDDYLEDSSNVKKVQLWVLHLNLLMLRFI